MIKKVISAVLAVTLVSSVFITAYAADTAKVKKYFKPDELSGMFDFMTGKSDDEASENLDVNEDGVVNILDTISMKEYIYEDYSYYKHVLSYSDYEKDINSSEKLNRMAETVSDTLDELLHEDIPRSEQTGRYISSDDGSETAEEVNRIIHDKYGYRDLKWKADYSFFGTTKVMCSVNGEKSGAFPYGIPEELSVPFDKVSFSVLTQTGGSETGWHSLYLSASKLNRDAMRIAGLAGALFPAQIRKGNYTEEDFAGQHFYDSESDDDVSILIGSVIGLESKYDYRWSVQVLDGKITAVVVTDITENVTGAFPESVPQSLEIPYSTALLEYACGDKNWKEDFSECISQDTDIAALPDYADVSDSDAEIKAFWLYSYMKEYYPDPIENIKDGVYDVRKIEEELPEIVSDRLFLFLEPLFSHEHIYLTFTEGKLSSVEYRNDGCDKTVTVSYERYIEAVNEETESVTSSSGGSRMVSAQIVEFNGDEDEKEKVPDPDYHLYYSTDPEGSDNTVITLRPDDEINKKPEWVVKIPDDSVIS